MKEFYLSGYNNLQLHCKLFDNVTNPKGVILVIHGMQEHSGRYEEFGNTLNKAGYIVVASDSRGHGKTIKNISQYGFGEKDIYAETIKDQLNIIEYIKKQFANLPIYLFGHSYGSMLGQKLIQVSSDIKKAILCGTNYGNNISYALGKVVAGVLKLFGQANKPAAAIETLGIKAWGKKFEHGNWLSRNNVVFEKYNADPLCGGSFPISFYHSLFKHMTKVNKGIKNINKDTKILLIVGSEDPVSSGGKYVKKLHKKYLQNNLNSQLIIYPEARHELINETNKQQVYNDIINFYNN